MIVVIAREQDLQNETARYGNTHNVESKHQAYTHPATKGKRWLKKYQCQLQHLMGASKPQEENYIKTSEGKATNCQDHHCLSDTTC